MCGALTYLLDNIFFRFDTNLYRQIVGFPVGTNCASLIADFFHFIFALKYEKRFYSSLSDDKEADIFQAFKSRRFSNIDSPYMEGMVGPPELQLNKGYASDTKSPYRIYIHLFQTDLFN